MGTKIYKIIDRKQQLIIIIIKRLWKKIDLKNK